MVLWRLQTKEPWSFFDMLQQRWRAAVEEQSERKEREERGENNGKTKSQTALAFCRSDKSNTQACPRPHTIRREKTVQNTFSKN